MLSLLLMFGEGSLLFAGDTVIVPEHELVEASNQRPKIFFQRVFSRIQSGAQRPGHGSSAGNDQNRVKPGLFLSLIHI